MPSSQPSPNLSRTSHAPEAIQAPIVERLPPDLSSVDAFLRLSRKPACLFLDSALRHRTLGRYSFVTADPFHLLEAQPDKKGALNEIRSTLSRFHGAAHPGLPPFQGGIAGLFGYELNRSLERLPAPEFDEFQTPAVYLGVYDVVLAFDHHLGESWLISQGFPETDLAGRRQRAAERAAEFLSWLQEPSPELPNWDSEADQFVEIQSPQNRTSADPNVYSNFDPNGYRNAVRQAVEYIRAGDVFQVNLSQRLLHPSQEDPRRLYLRMRNRNAATFAAYFDAGQHRLISASPERFLAIRDGLLETRPIKGTRPRIHAPEADLFAASDLKNSEKDIAENVMIVDLLRNDLSRVCQPDSIRVSALCQLESYAYVQHLVSSVEGRLCDGLSCVDAVTAAFPGGSITGAPKIRAMEIITELERVARGAYCGSLGYLGFDGVMDLSILIRTLTASRGWWQLPVGGGVVAQSTPEMEYQETWQKAAGMLRALRP